MCQGSRANGGRTTLSRADGQSLLLSDGGRIGFDLGIRTARAGRRQAHRIGVDHRIVVARVLRRTSLAIPKVPGPDSDATTRAIRKVN
jgi:hypothetical protein